MLGARYGAVQDSGLSATHEEFREACDDGAVAVFVEEHVEPEPAQVALIEEARDWATGRIFKPFRDAEDLRSKVTRSLHDFIVARESTSVDTEELVARAHALLPGSRSGSVARLHLVVTGGPRREVVPPAKLEEEALARSVTKEALFGSWPVFNRTEGTETKLSGDTLVLEQQSSSICLNEEGSVRITVPAVQGSDQANAALPVLVEEDVADALAGMIGFAAWLLDEIDPNRRLADVVVLASLDGAGYMGWKTHEEVRSNPHRAQMSMHGDQPVIVPHEPNSLPRPALIANREGVARDLLVRLRRKMRS